MVTLSLAGLTVLALGFAIFGSVLGRKVYLLGAIGSAFVCGVIALHGGQLETTETFRLLPELGVWWALRLDGLSWAFALLVSGMGSLIFLYSYGYMKKYKREAYFASSLAAFEVSMLGLVLSDNIYVFFLFWELTSLTSYLLVTYKATEEKVILAARQVLTLTVGGGLFLLAGLVWWQQAAMDAGASLIEASHFSELLSLSLNSSVLSGIFLLLLAGAATKSAQIPFHFWLPQAMAAPTPVSSYLHSATMVKAGCFLLARVHPAFFEAIPLWSQVLIPLGIATAFWGALISLTQSDLKKILAYTTVSVLGFLVFLLGCGHEKALTAFVALLFGHALYKAALFQVAGSVDLLTGSRELHKLSGLVKAAPLLAYAGMLAALSNSGFPPFFGFFGKELLYEAQLVSGQSLLLVLALLANVFMMVSALNVGIKVFFLGGKGQNSPETKPVSSLIFIVPAILAGLGLVFGLFPGLLENSVGNAMLSGILLQPAELTLKLWHGVQGTALWVLILSALTLGLGLSLFFKFEVFRPFLSRFVAKAFPEGDELFEVCHEKTSRFFDWLTKGLQHGVNAWYLAIFVAFQSLVLLLGWNAYSSPNWAIPNIGTSLIFLFTVCFIIVASSLFVLWMKSLLSIVIAIGALGLGLALIFTLLGAPDLALTQVLVETAVAVLLAVIARKAFLGPLGVKSFFFAIRVVLAGAFSVLLFYSLQGSGAEPRLFEVANYYREASLSEAFGRNIVNVILVDFRALDTLNEVLVVLVAALGVFALLRKGRTT